MLQSEGSYETPLAADDGASIMYVGSYGAIVTRGQAVQDVLTIEGELRTTPAERSRVPSSAVSAFGHPQVGRME